MIVIVTRKEITMVARNTSELVDALNQEDEESLKILFSKKYDCEHEAASQKFFDQRIHLYTYKTSY